MTEKPDAAARAGTFTAWLLAHGRRPWDEITPLLADCTCAWADLDGFHAGPPPPAPPLATHLWAWDDGRLLRIRIDSGHGIAAELSLAGPGQGEPVTVAEREARSWPSGEGRVSAGAEWRDRIIRVYITVAVSHGVPDMCFSVTRGPRSRLRRVAAEAGITIGTQAGGGGTRDGRSPFP